MTLQQPNMCRGRLIMRICYYLRAIQVYPRVIIFFLEVAQPVIKKDVHWVKSK